MKLLKFVSDKPLPKGNKVIKRSAARAVLFDDKNLVPILFVSKFNYHKLPGGGIEEGESKETALAREILEETGCTAKITGEIGKITEYRSEWDLFQTSYCYIGNVANKGPDKYFTEEEKAGGFELVWLTLDEAIDALKNDKPTDYEGKFIRQRDLIFLQETKKIRG